MITIPGWVFTFYVVGFIAEAVILVHLGKELFYSEKRHQAQLNFKESQIALLSEALVDSDTPELRLLTEGNRWGLEMSPETQDWEVRAHG